MQLGTNRNNNEKIDIDSNILARHAAMLGSTGSGKTVMAKISYKSAGVDIDAGNEAVDRIKNSVQSTFTSNVLDGLGGFGQGRLPHAYQYRDWITNAFNRDLSYDQFVRLQVAGPADANSPDAPATGFLALGPTYKSDGGDPDSKAQAQSETLHGQLRQRVPRR